MAGLDPALWVLSHLYAAGISFRVMNAIPGTRGRVLSHWQNEDDASEACPSLALHLFRYLPLVPLGERAHQALSSM